MDTGTSGSMIEGEVVVERGRGRARFGSFKLPNWGEH